jgi:hypothetical protein
MSKLNIVPLKSATVTHSEVVIDAGAPTARGNATPTFTNKVTLSDTSPLSPSLASLNGNVYIAWRGDGNDNLNAMGSADQGGSFGGKSTFGDTSTVAPALCAHNGNLYIAWKGDGNDNLNVAQVTVSGTPVR